MAERKTGKVIHVRALSASLEILRLLPEDRSAFPAYKAGQHIALSRAHCRLTKKIVGDDGRVGYVYEVDGSGVPKRGPVTRSYSISSALFETQEKGYLECYVALEMIEAGIPRRLSESLLMVGTGSGLAPFASMIKQLHSDLLGRVQPEKSVILTCGNAKMMEDIEYLAGVQNIRFEKEDW